jgi:hypothetical protein
LFKNVSNRFRNGDIRPEETAGIEGTQVRRGSAGVVQKSKEREGWSCLRILFQMGADPVDGESYLSPENRHTHTLLIPKMRIRVFVHGITLPICRIESDIKH